MMNTKRWIALLAVAVLFIAGSVANFSSWRSDVRQAPGGKSVTGFLDGGQLNEKVLEPGSAKERIALLTVEGTIQDLGDTPFASGYNHRFFMEQLKALEEDNSVKGIVLSVNSPGGGVVESAEMYRGLTRLQEKYNKPIYVSMGAMAASGGYYISAPAKRIYANEETLTGSIGVIMSSLNTEGLMKKLGVEEVVIKTGPFKDIMSPTRAMRPDERKLLQGMIDESYERFVGVISKGRKMPVEQVKKIGDGRIYSGSQAKKIGLVDEIGFEEDAIRAMKKDLKIESATVFEYEQGETLPMIFRRGIASTFLPDFRAQMYEKLLATSSAPRMMYLYGE